ncbi:hypothetical protein IT157_10735 [bacterium]|nr:hypothetical protein [bacterium]
MIRTQDTPQARRDGGYIMIAMTALVATLLGTGIAFMQWASDEVEQTHHSEAAMQAFYLAQSGIIEKGLAWLEGQQAGLLPRTETILGDGEVRGVGRYRDVRISPVFGSLQDPNNFSFLEKFKITAYGEVEAPWWDEGGNIDAKKVVRKAVLYVQVRSFSDYMYLTDVETSLTFPGDVVRFWGRDTLWGRTHSNDWIATQNVNGLPVFYDIVSTTKPSFRPGSPNPAGQFLGGAPYFNAPYVVLPALAEPIREGAASEGHFYEVVGHEWRAFVNGANLQLYHWPEGTPFDPAVATMIPISLGDWPCVFVNNGRMEVLGVMSASNMGLTLGCSDDIRIIDDLMFQGTNMTNGTLPPACSSMLGLVGESWIYIANTWENGREGCTGTTPDHCHIVITAALVVLGSSFQFEQMNDVFDPYISPVAPDNRGNIVMTGSITQRYRGYVHRSNLGDTGYGKVYHYDYRFLSQRPPCFLGAEDDEGRALFNITQWGQASEDPVDVARGRRVRYN